MRQAVTTLAEPGGSRTYTSRSAFDANGRVDTLTYPSGYGAYGTGLYTGGSYGNNGYGNFGYINPYPIIYANPYNSFANPAAFGYGPAAVQSFFGY